MTIPTGYVQFRRKQIAELRPWTPDFDMSKVSVSDADFAKGSPQLGDMIARNPKNHDDQWLVAAQYFADNFEPLAASPAAASAERPLVHEDGGMIVHWPERAASAEGETRKYIEVTDLDDTAIKDIEAHISGKLPGDKTYDAPRLGWTCFHCGANFRTVEGARLHFGALPSPAPVCSPDQSAARIAELTTALRKLAIRRTVRLAYEGREVPTGGHCVLCRTDWSQGEPEKHALGCLAALASPPAGRE